MPYLYVVLALIVAVLAFIGGLVLWRRRAPGDHTAGKVVVGVGLVEIARYANGLRVGMPDAWQAQQFGLMGVAGALIVLWQLAEWGRRQWERHDRRIKLLEERTRARSAPARRGGDT